MKQKNSYSVQLMHAVGFVGSGTSCAEVSSGWTSVDCAFENTDHRDDTRQFWSRMNSSLCTKINKRHTKATIVELEFDYHLLD